VFAQQNLFDNGATPGLVVRDASNGGGTGVLNVSNPLDPNHAYVQSLFLELLGRAGDPATGGEIDQWVSQLAKKGNRGVAKAILFSDESVGRIVNDVFTEFLDRNPDATELAKYSKQLKSGKDITRVEASILGSVEFVGRISTDFVQALYLDVLNRPATSVEVTKAYKSLPTLGLKGLAAKIAGSKERRLDFAEDLYRDLLHREPSSDEAAALAKKPGGLLKVELLVLSSDDYFNHG